MNSHPRSTWLLDLMHTRRSVRRFSAEPVPREILERILSAAITAPSASNKQPWRFFVVTDRARIDRMAAAVRSAVDEIASHVPSESEAPLRAYGDYFTRFELAPVVIAVLHRGMSLLSNLVDSGLGDEARARIARMERDSGLIGASLAIQNLLLMAHAEGLGASGMTGPLVADAEIKKILEVPESWGIAALVPIGYPAEEPAPPSRKPLGKVVRWIE
jgi:nitroreductase